MKYITMAGILAAIAIFTGCANLSEYLRPQTDPTVASTDAAASSAKTWVDRFLKYEEANPQLVGMDARVAAEGLRKRFDGNLKDLQNIKTLYQQNQTDANRSRLMMALEAVMMDQSIAQGYLSGNTLPQRGQGAPYAPQIGFAPPNSQPTVLDNIFERLGGLQAEQASQRAELQMIRTNLGKLGRAVWSITNQTTEGNGVATNREPPVPQKPGTNDSNPE